MNRKIRQQRIRLELEKQGVNIIDLPGGAVRLHGAFNNVLVVIDLLSLTASEIKRLTAWAP